jgi:hypothetical protein
VFLPDSTSTTGAGKTGLTNASGGLNIAVRREKSAAFTSYTGANISTITTLGTWADPTSGKCRFKEVDATNAPGLYELHFVDALYDASDTSRKLLGFVQATGVAPTPFEIVLTAVDVQSAAAFITGVNSTAPPTNWNLESIDANGRVDVIKINGQSQTARDIGASVLLSSGTGTGQIDITSGVVKSNLAQILGTALTETAGLIAAGFKKFFNVASPAGTVNSLPAAAPDVLGGLPLLKDLTSLPYDSVGVYAGISALGSGTGIATSAVQTTQNTTLARIIGLLGKNQGLRNITLDGNGNLLTADLCVYSSKANAQTNDGTTGLLYKYSIVDSYSGTNLASHVETEEV